VFGIVGRRVMRRGNFKSLAELQDRLLEFIGYFNRHLRNHSNGITPVAPSKTSP
jgi:hypothetical protein